MYLYTGVNLVLRPDAWEGFVPEWLYQGLGSSEQVFLFLRFQGIMELALAFLFLAWFLEKKVLRFAGTLCAVEMALILIVIGIDNVTFRDIGLLGAGLALAVIKES
jgi:hypothetical protein